MPNPVFNLMTPTTSDAQKIAQVVQAMVTLVTRGAIANVVVIASS